MIISTDEIVVKQTRREKPGVLPKPKRVLKIRPLNDFDRKGRQAGIQKEREKKKC